MLSTLVMEGREGEKLIWTLFSQPQPDVINHDDSIKFKLFAW